jgi:predicted outer membrane repeat protein
MRTPDSGPDGNWGTVDDDYGDLRLMDTSPAIDAGDNDAVVAILSDLPGNPRRADVTGVADTGNGTAPIVDQGAYENPPILLYVDHTAAGAGNGLSWTDAYPEAKDAVVRGLSGPTEIWVAAGSYTPGTEREDTFTLLSGMELYGGFPSGGGGGSFEVRDWENYPTILSGEIGDSAKTSDNSYQVVLAYKAKGGTVVDGFTVQEGNADGYYHAIHGPPYQYMLTQRCTTYKKIGGGLCSDESDLTLNDMVFRDNYGEIGGGIYHIYGSLFLDQVNFDNNNSGVGGGIYNTLDDLDSSGAVFRNNTAEYGGGIFTQDADVDLVNTIFEGNTTDWGGGGMYFSGGNVVQLSNALFSGNLAQKNGGAMFIEQGSTITLINNTISANQAILEGGGIYNHQSEANLSNTIMWGNQAPTGEDVLLNGGTFTAFNSLIKTGCPPAGLCGNLLTVDPLFQRSPDAGTDGTWGTADDDYGDLRLAIPSPAIDAGDNSAVWTDIFDLDEDGDTVEMVPFDLSGRPRFYDTAGVADTGVGTAPIVDMGAYETSPYWIYLPMILR